MFMEYKLRDARAKFVVLCVLWRLPGLDPAVAEDIDIVDGKDHECLLIIYS